MLITLTTSGCTVLRQAANLAEVLCCEYWSVKAFFMDNLSVQRPTERVVIRNERQLVIREFQDSDVGTYTCSVEFDLPSSIKQGEASIPVTAVSRKWQMELDRYQNF